jgi:hypothetical protein
MPIEILQLKQKLNKLTIFRYKIVGWQQVMVFKLNA